MSKAELHGKLSSDRLHDGMEDLLTSDVFGTMYYTGWNYGFLDWLLLAQQTMGVPKSFAEFLGPSPAEHIQYAFWPRLSNRREPDVAMLLRMKDQSYRLVIVEAKYLSGPSNFEVEQSADDLTGDQLADQILGIGANPSREIFRWFVNVQFDASVPLKVAHVYITTHTRVPEAVYRDSRRHVGDSPSVDAYWLSWRALFNCLVPFCRDDDASSRLITDLRALLLRKGLSGPYQGFARMGDLPNLGTSASFWTSRPHFTNLNWQASCDANCGPSFWRRDD